MDQGHCGDTAQRGSQVTVAIHMLPLFFVWLWMQVDFSNLVCVIFSVKPGSVGFRRAACTETLHLLPWMVSISLSLVQTTVEDMEIVSQESASVIWVTQVQHY